MLQSRTELRERDLSSRLFFDLLEDQVDVSCGQTAAKEFAIPCQVGELALVHLGLVARERVVNCLKRRGNAFAFFGCFDHIYSNKWVSNKYDVS